MLILIILFISNISFCTLFRLMVNTKSNEINHQCLNKAVEILFGSFENLRVIYINKILGHDDLYRSLYKNYSFFIERKAKFETNRKKYIIIEESLEALKNVFDQSASSKWSEYLILIKSSTGNISEFAAYLYRKEFYQVAFLQTDKNGEITLSQFDPKLTDNKKILLKTNCSNNFELKENSQRIIHPFKQIIYCPINGCKLTFRRLIVDAPHEVIHEEGTNGSRISKSHAAHAIEKFANKFGIKMTNSIQDSDTDKNWDEVTSALLDDKIDILYGFSLPDAKNVEAFEITTWIGYVFIIIIHREKSSY